MAPAKETSLGLGLTQDISAAGALMLTRSHFTVGERIQLEMRLLEGNAPSCVVCGRVVRTAPLSLDETGLWRSHTAVEFENALSGMETLFDTVAQRQANRWHRT